MPILEITQKELEISPDTISELRVDASFRKLSRNAICFHIWKIEEDRLEVVARENFGSFYDDCCYIIYAACPAGTYVNQDTISREIKNATGLERFIHFWLGEKVTQQKKANVAHKVMELDTYFGNVATEYRESQGNESERFMSYFRRGITIYSGALVSSTDTCRLFQIRGRQFLSCVEMDSIDWHNFGSEYIMILNTGKETFMWIGRSSNVGDRREALAIATRFKNSTCASELIIIDDGYEQSMKDEHAQIWNTLLPRSDRVVNQGNQIDKPYSSSFKLYKCGYKGTKYWIDQITSTLPSQSDLNDSMAVYILNGFSLGVWMWIGKNVPNVENIEAIRNGRGFIKKKKYPSSTLLIRVIEGHEPIEFTHLFPGWVDRETKTTHILGKFDTMSLSQRPKMAAENQLVDDGTGEKHVYQVMEDYLKEIFTRKSAAFFQTDSCYIVQYTVAFCGTQNFGVNNIVYMWIGKEASPEAISKCTKFGKERFHKLGDKTMVVKMNESDETPHFLQIFSGKFVILKSNISNGNMINGNGNINNNNSSHQNLSKLEFFKVQGDSTFTSKAWQIQPLNALTGKDCYVIRSSSDMVWVWCGQSSTGDAREVAKNIGSIFADECNLVMEGKEPKELWDSVSNQIRQTENSTSSSSLYELPQATIGIPIDKTKVHLHLVYNYRGKLLTQEILGFGQSDLLPENTYILDAGAIAFVWCGKLSLPDDEEGFGAIAQEFLETSTTPRRTTTAIALVRQHNEPNIFTGFFDSWDRKFFDTYVPFEKMRHDITRNGYSNGFKIVEQSFKNDSNFDQHPKYPLSVLQQEAVTLPTEVNPLKREVHLTHDDFVSLFGMPFLEFEVLPAWKKQELKKKFKLF
ncbi:villin-like protein quail isoform X2 [Eupeodes corollae]|uniref:villin-like protein quail isoform X2 n=1 Tax=Eupeodes corollae TaxID=290404 RepID=UPI0024903FAC|nr:villin-like protein quail isoform X2 [Eupeodes corollae]